MNKSLIAAVFIILTIVVIGVKAKRSPNSKDYWKQWDQASSLGQPMANEPARKIAQDKKPLQCLDTEQRINFLKKRISLLDKRTPSKDKELFNKSISLKNFTQQESDFFKKYPKFFATLEVEASDCKDSACFFKKVYKSADDYEGLILYYFYLENGYVIGTSNDLPRTSKIADYGYDKYLFSRNELDFFLYSSVKLSDKFKFMSSLNSIHRLPQGLVMSLYPSACGLNWSSKNQGDILLMDGCLRDESGHESVIHEIAHSLDKILDNKLSSFSESKEWLDFGGWTIKESKDSAGRVSRQWIIRDDVKYDEFISSYSSTQPSEDFADSISRYVTTPEELLAKSPKKFQFIKTKIFNGRSFDRASQDDWYSNKMLISLKLEFPGIVKACLTNKDLFKSTEIEKLGLEGELLDPELISCFKGGMESFLTNKLKEYAEIDIYSCDYFLSSERSLIELTIENYKETLKSSLQDNELLAQR
ncbi:MAG: hypothetical protein K2Q18_09685, partial [Bdellovibrionales bacterium]|nr:hypothetical protein [Bdellovibrionales bacterium]